MKMWADRSFENKNGHLGDRFAWRSAMRIGASTRLTRWK